MNTIRYYKAGNKVTLYDRRKNKRFRGTLYIRSSSAIPSTYHLQKVASTSFLLALLGFITIIIPVLYASIHYHFFNANAQIPKAEQKIPNLSEIPVNNEFFLEIPKINLTSVIIPNVDASNEDQYLEKLKVGVAHAKGSYLPGDNGPIVLFSHSTDTLAHIVWYNARFYGLKDLQIGDKATIHFKGKIYTYTVIEKKIIEPQDMDTIRNYGSKLIMTTCWPPGTDWQRLAVFLN